VVSAYESENQSLKVQLADAQTKAAQAAAGPRALYGAGGPAAYQPAAGQVPGLVNSGLGRGTEIKVISFGSAIPGGTPGLGGTPPPKGIGAGGGVGSGPGTAVSVDSPNYLPANSFAKARVIVGVDAASNVQSQADPLPVVLRITGPARSVSDRGKVLMTRIEGCLVNGAARGDLSSEKVYVRLAKMTCPQPGGRFAESEVKGFIAFGGKTGVRGRVVSREGSLAIQAFMAGLVGGIGRGFSANSQSFLQGATTIVNGQRSKLSASEIAQAGLGEGVSKAGDEVSQYLIERAEQYQPVIEMPTGIDVEIVFLEGVMVRN
jgi:conjugal transfer pilus assembly protein TraB